MDRYSVVGTDYPVFAFVTRMPDSVNPATADSGADTASADHRPSISVAIPISVDFY